MSLLEELREQFKKDNNEGVVQLQDYYANAQQFWKHTPFFFDRAGIFWIWKKKEYRYVIADETDMLKGIDFALRMTGQTITSTIKNNYLEAFRRFGRGMIPKEPDKHWVQFHDVLYDYDMELMIPATPEYFICNPIPWKMGEKDHTPTLDRLFEDWVGEKNVQTLYEIIAYCCLNHMPIHLIFCFIGSGRNGKSQFQRILAKFLGVHNVCSTELDTLLGNRFESFKLFKKLVCQLGETNFGVLKQTGLLKKLSGGDLIGFEAKHKVPFDGYNYAKIVINTNSLPTSTDQSEGFYRRWFIVDFPNDFPEGKDICLDVPSWEFESLACKVGKMIKSLLDRGRFTHQGSIEERRDKFIESSNPLPFFLKSHCMEYPDAFVIQTDLYKAFVKYLQERKKRIVSRKEFKQALLEEGYQAMQTTRDNHVGWYLLGLRLKTDQDDIQKEKVIS